ncbi:MAG: group 1 truncated hemoglobin [Myxococcales bacterium]
MSTVYERIGGEDAILAAATLFYEKVLADPELAPFFAGLDMSQQIRKQVALMAWAFGGPQKYTYRGLNEAHAGLRAKGLNDRHFDAVAGHLAATLKELGVPDDLAGEAMAIVASTRDQVMGRAG